MLFGYLRLSGRDRVAGHSGSPSAMRLAGGTINVPGLVGRLRPGRRRAAGSARASAARPPGADDPRRPAPGDAMPLIHQLAPYPWESLSSLVERLRQRNYYEDRGAIRDLL